MCKNSLTQCSELEDNTIQMKSDLQKFMYQLRIQADVEVVEMVNILKMCFHRYQKVFSEVSKNIFICIKMNALNE